MSRMMNLWLSCLLVFSISLMLPGPIDANEIKPIAIGQAVPKLDFKDIRYLRRTLNDLPQSKVIVLAFVKIDCPISKRYLPVLKRLEADYRARGVQFALVNVGVEDSIMDMAEQALDYEIDFPVLKDFDAVSARSLGITRVPEVAVLQPATKPDAPRTQKLIYRGRIDDQYRFGGTQQSAARNELRDALDAALAEKMIAISETPAEGCLITIDEPQPPSDKVTFAEHIAPILKQHCSSCHRPNTAASFSLLTYQDAASHADMIAEVVREQRMPPWYGSPKHGEFINRRGLTSDERTTVLHWVRSGKPRGDDTNLPSIEPSTNADEKWLIGKPDLVLTELLPHNLPAEGVLPYQYTAFPHVFLPETWLESIQILPDNPAVVHHCNAGFMQLGEKVTNQNFITGFVPGGQPMELPDGVAVRIPGGSVIGVQIHFVTTGKPERCRIKMGFRFARRPVRQQLRFELLDDHRFQIPPGAALHPVATSRMLKHDAIGIGLFSHMHLRGRDMTFIAHRPEQAPEKLLVIPNYNFGWQHGYQWESSKVRFPKGTRIECIAHYDNSEFNPFNPNPKVVVREGPQSFDEMINGFMFYIDANEDLQLAIDPKTGTAKPSS